VKLGTDQIVLPDDRGKVAAVFGFGEQVGGSAGQK
jgi:hypothetical protein